MTDVKRQLVIKTGAVKRLTKELTLYREEKEQEQSRVDKLKAAGADKHDLKHAEDVLAEARMMIPNTLQRLKDNLHELTNLQGDAPHDLTITDEFQEANRVAKSAQDLVNSE